VTVYASLMFLVVFLLLSMCLEGAYLYLGKGKAQGAYMAALAGARGNYQKELEQQYHLFGLDVRYGKQLDEKLAEALKYNLTESRDPFSFYPGSVRTSHKVSLADRRGEILREQIAEFMKYDLGKDGIRLLTDNVFKMPKEDDASRAREVINEADREAKEEEEAEETGKKTETKTPVRSKDPRKGLVKVLREGMVTVVLGKEAEVSEQNVPIVYGHRDTKKEKNPDFYQAESVSQSLKGRGQYASSTGIKTELMGTAYGVKYFRNYTSKEKKKGLQYETEYLIAGKESEKENLGSVFSKILLMRFLPNLIYVQGDTVKQGQAEALAVSILGITGLVPVVKLAKHLLLAALAYGESILDLRNLSEGKQVPLWKSKDTWQMEFAGLSSLTGRRKSVKKGLSYKDYLQVLLFLQTEKQEKYLRMMDVIEDNIKRKVPGFSLKDCYVSFEAETNMSLNPFRFGGINLPVMGRYQWPMKEISQY